MKYLLSENKIINLVGNLIHNVYPKFNKEDSEVIKWNNEDEIYYEYFDPKLGGRPFAKYWEWKKELQLNRDLFETLERYLGDDLMVYAIDWFNNEFSQDAEYITF